MRRPDLPRVQQVGPVDHADSAYLQFDQVALQAIGGKGGVGQHGNFNQRQSIAWTLRHSRAKRAGQSLRIRSDTVDDPTIRGGSDIGYWRLSEIVYRLSAIGICGSRRLTSSNACG